MIKRKLALFWFLFSLGALGETSPRNMVISANAVSAVHGSASVLFQYRLTDYLALTIPGFFGTNWIANSMVSTMAVIANTKHESSLLFGGGGVGARFFVYNTGLNDGFFVEPRVVVNMSKYHLRNDTVDLIKSNRVSLMPAVLLGYSWFWDHGFYLSTGIEIGGGFHMKNDITVENSLSERLKDKTFLRNRLWADKGRWRFDYGYDVSFGFAF